MAGSGEEATPRSQMPVRREPGAGRRPEEVALGLAVSGAHLGLRAGRIAMLPWRIAGRLAGTSRVDRTAARLGADGRAAAARGRALAEQAVDRTLAGPLPEEVAQKLVDHHVVERVVAEVLKQVDLEAALTEALDDERTREQLERALASPALERLVVTAVESKLAGEAADRLLASPQVRAAFARQSRSLAEQLVDEVCDRATQVDDRVSLGRARAADGYGGFATRGIALVIDTLLAHVCVLAPAAVIALVASLAGGLGSGWLVDTILGVGWFVVVAVYFVFFWSAAGHTPGMILMRLRVTDGHDARPTIVRAAVRFVGLILSIIPLFAGFLPVLFDARRRGLADFLAGTVVRTER